MKGSRMVWRTLTGSVVTGLLSLGHLATWPLGQPVAWAEVPQVINYQGRLTEADGVPLVGDHTVTFRIYNAQTQGSKLWEEAHQISLARQDDGIFSIVLGSLSAFGVLDFNQPLWLSLEVDGEGEMAPRQRLTAVGYAINADTLDGLDNSQFLRADVETVAKGQLRLARPGLALLIQPSTNPGANTKLIDVQNAAGNSKFSVDLEGDVSVAGDLAIAGTISGSTSTTGTISTSWTIGSQTDAATNNLSLLFGQTSGQGSIVFQGASTDDFAFSDDLRLSAQSELRLEDAAGAEYVALKAPTGVTTHTLTFPATLGSAGQVLSTDASGNLSWATDANSGGTITEVVAGQGLTGGGTGGSVTLDVGSGTGMVVTADALSVDVGTTAGKIVQLDAAGALPAVSGANLTSLPNHASRHQPGGVDALPTATAVDVGSANSEGTSTSLSRADHVHQGVHAIRASGQPQLFGDVNLAAGDNVTLTQAGQTITIAAAGEDLVLASTFSSSSVAIGTSQTTLLSVTITKANPNSALLIIASVALSQSSGGAKIVNVKLHRDGTLLDGAYPSRIGPGVGTVQNDVVTIHAWDPTTSGTHTIDLRADASSSGATAAVRRLTVVELL